MLGLRANAITKLSKIAQKLRQQQPLRTHTHTNQSHDRSPMALPLLGVFQGLLGEEQVGGVRGVREGGAAPLAAAREPLSRAAPVGVPAHGHGQGDQGVSSFAILIPG